ncbi:hypothetical protein ACPUEK_04725 [Marinomonas gallaica]|uniref:hypothetical protein n=1 Tax=Marinomonas gallaica TaxID=1806667 RepID=UPI003CE579D9
MDTVVVILAVLLNSYVVGFFNKKIILILTPFYFLLSFYLIWGDFNFLEDDLKFNIESFFSILWYWVCDDFI